MLEIKKIKSKNNNNGIHKMFLINFTKYFIKYKCTQCQCSI